MLRNEKQLKVRQPLNTMYISSEKDIEKSIRDFEPIIKEELNVKTIDLIKDESILNDMKKYLTNILNINKNFDYWEIDKEKLFIEME